MSNVPSKDSMVRCDDWRQGLWDGYQSDCPWCEVRRLKAQRTELIDATSAEIERLRAALVRVADEDHGADAQEIAKAALGFETPLKHSGECICPTCGIRHGAASTDGGF